MAVDFNPVLDISVEAAEDLSSYQYHFVILDATTGKARLLDSASEIADGVLQNAPVAGEGATIRVLGASKVVANDAITVNTFVKPEYVSGTDCGKADAQTTTYEQVGGRVIEASAAENDLVTVILSPYAGLTKLPA